DAVRVDPPLRAEDALQDAVRLARAPHEPRAEDLVRRDDDRLPRLARGVLEDGRELHARGVLVALRLDRLLPPDATGDEDRSRAAEWVRTRDRTLQREGADDERDGVPGVELRALGQGERHVRNPRAVARDRDASAHRARVVDEEVSGRCA